MLRACLFAGLATNLVEGAATQSQAGAEAVHMVNLQAVHGAVHDVTPSSPEPYVFPSNHFGDDTRFQTAQLGTEVGGILVGATQSGQLLVALEQIKQDIIMKSRELKEQMEWVDEVGGIIRSYEEKLERVKADIAKNRQEIRDMLKKRRQLQNLRAQKQLQEKLKNAEGDLATLDGALKSVDGQRKKFQQQKQDIESTIKTLESHSDTLNGVAASSSGAAGGADAAKEAAAFLEKIQHKGDYLY